MSKRILLIALLVIGFIFLVSSFAVAQTLPSGYDEDEEDITRNDEGAGTTFVQDLEEIRRKRINDIIQKMKQGDPNVLRFIVYDVFEEVHREIIRRAREANTSYYDILGMSEAIPAFIGGFDNQDPKVRLRCIGWLGDWVDEIGLDLADIQKRTRDRIVSRIETREEVRYAFRILDLKIVRKTILNKIYNGDERILQNITATEFIVLIHDEIFLRTAYCIDPRIRIRSIRLAPWWIDVKVLNAVVAHRLSYTRLLNQQAFERIYDPNNPNYNTQLNENNFIYANVAGSVVQDQYKNFLNLDEERSQKKTDVDTLILPIVNNVPEGYSEKTADNLGYNVEVPATDRNAALANDILRGREFEYLTTYYYTSASATPFFYIGYYDYANNWDIQSLYDIRYFNYSESGSEFHNEDKFVRALFAGLTNRHLVVRENVARILIMLSDPFIQIDYTGTVVGVKGIIRNLARESKYVEWAIKAWEEVRYSQYIDVARPAEFIDTDGDGVADDDIRYYHVDGNKINYGRSVEWGYIWNYRIDIHELLRRMGLGQLFQCDIQSQAAAPPPPRATGRNTYFVESLFDLTEIDVLNIDLQAGSSGSSFNIWNLIPDWHGVDEIEDEVFNPRP
jgi:hypothetical protein